MKENKFYVYVYLDPRKPGKFEYLENGIGITFDFEPFYIGKGEKKRMFMHLWESKNLKNHQYKHNRIRKIWAVGLEPIIYKIYENMLEQPALDLERTLGFLIGRYNLKEGPLTNEVDLGDRTTRPSKENSIKKGLNISKTKQNKSPEEKAITNQKISESKKGIKPSLETRQKLSEQRQGKNNPFYNKHHTPETLEIIGFKSRTIKKKRVKGNPNKGKTYDEIYGVEEAKLQRESRSIGNKGKIILQESIDKRKQRYIDDPEKQKRETEKANKTRELNGSCKGKKHPRYIDLNLDRIIELNNESKSIKEIALIFNVGEHVIRRRLKNPDKFR